MQNAHLLHWLFFPWYQLLNCWHLSSHVLHLERRWLACDHEESVCGVVAWDGRPSFRWHAKATEAAFKSNVQYREHSLPPPMLSCDWHGSNCAKWSWDSRCSGNIVYRPASMPSEDSWEHLRHNQESLYKHRFLIGNEPLHDCRMVTAKLMRSANCCAYPSRKH